jgi:hypothetical protein
LRFYFIALEKERASAKILTKLNLKDKELAVQYSREVYEPIARNMSHYYNQIASFFLAHYNPTNGTSWKHCELAFKKLRLFLKIIESNMPNSSNKMNKILKKIH